MQPSKSEVTIRLFTHKNEDYWDLWFNYRNLKSPSIDDYRWILELNGTERLTFENHFRAVGTLVTEGKFMTRVKSNNQFKVLGHYMTSKELEEYKRNKNKERVNPWDPEYVMKRDRISLAQAKIKVEQLKSNKATSLAGFILRHGEVEGTKKFKKFQSTSVSMSLEAMVKRYGEKEGTTRFEKTIEDNKKKNKRCIEYWLENGHSLEKSKILVSEYQRNNSGVHREYHRNKGVCEEVIDHIISHINYKRSENSYSYSNPRKYAGGERWLETEFKARCVVSYENLKENTCLTREEKVIVMSVTFNSSIKLEDYGLILPAGENYYSFIEDNIEKFKEVYEKIQASRDGYENYIRKCIVYSEMQDLTKLENSDKLRGKSGVEGAYQLDHIYSIHDGYINNISPEVIGSIHNLQFIPWLDNIRKHKRSDLTLEELLAKIEEEE